MCKALKVDIKSTELYSDAGGEFSMGLFKPVFKKAENVPTGSSVENKNRQFEQIFFRCMRQRKATTIESAMSQTQKLLNNQLNRIHKQTPNELVERNNKKQNIKEYNDKRKDYIQGDKRKPFEVGTYVRLQVKNPKPGIEYKSYKNITFSRRVFLVTKITKTTPRKYYVNGIWRTQDKLLLSAPRDAISNQLIKDRDEGGKKIADVAEAKHMKKRKKEIKEKPKHLRRSSRYSSKVANIEMLEDRAFLKMTDASLDQADLAEESKEIEEDEKELKKEEKKLGIKRKVEKPVPKEVEKKEVEKKPVDKSLKYRVWLKKRKLPQTGSLEVIKKRVLLAKKMIAYKKKIAKK